MTQIIRPITPSQSQLLTKISHKTFLETYQEQIPFSIINDYFDFDLNHQILSSETLLPQNQFYFIYHNDQIAGFVKIIFQPKQTLEIARFYILKSFQNQKLGLQTFEQIKTIAIQNKQTKITLNVWENNPKAIAFYTKLGFQKTGNIIFFLHKTPFNDHTMSLDL